MAEIIVIGAGIIGVSVAYRLAEAGARVTLIEADRPGGGTSATSFAWTNANEKTPQAYHDINVLGMRAHAALAAEFGAAPWRHASGAVEWRSRPEEAGELATRVGRLRGWGYRAEWITRAQALVLEPAVAAETIGDAAIAYFPDEGWVDPAIYIAAVLPAALRLGARLHHGRVRSIALASGAVTSVLTEAGETLGADLVINCTGRWASTMIQPARLRVPMAPTLGVLAYTPPVAADVRGIVRSSVCNLRPDGAGRLLVQSEDIDAAINADPDAQAGLAEADRVLRQAEQVVPALAGIAPEAVRIGTRAIPADGYSAVGPIPGVAGYYVAVTHSGVTLAPYLGRAVADEVMRGMTQSELSPFRPARLFASFGSL